MPPPPKQRSRRKPVAKSVRAAVMARDGGLCRYCDQPGDTLDHVLPVSRGGGNSPENLVVACKPCNLRKGALTPAEAGMPLR